MNTRTASQLHIYPSVIYILLVFCLNEGYFFSQGGTAVYRSNSPASTVVNMSFPFVSFRQATRAAILSYHKSVALFPSAPGDKSAHSSTGGGGGGGGGRSGGGGSVYNPRPVPTFENGARYGCVIRSLTQVTSCFTVSERPMGRERFWRVCFYYCLLQVLLRTALPMRTQQRRLCV